MQFYYSGPLPAHTDYSANHGAKVAVAESFEFKASFELTSRSEIAHALILVDQGILSLDKPKTPGKGEDVSR